MKRYGFTMLEILIVVFIIGILSALAIPGYRNARQNVLDKEVKAMLWMLAKAEEMMYLETGSTVNCMDNAECNAVLGIDLPLEHWNYKVLWSGGPTYCVQASGVVDPTKKWRMWNGETEPVADIDCSSP